ncbi:MAG: hypothetical protein JST15_08975 [Bacteroidetes bacterium]|nr:hypothetical protein [Bacteroidota bacterium]
MKTSDELLAIKMTIKTLSVKVKRIENVNKKLKKIIEVKEIVTKVSDSNETKKPGYLDRFRPEKRSDNYFNAD